MVSGIQDRKEKEQGTVQAAGRPAARLRGAGNEGGRAAWLSATVDFHPLYFEIRDRQPTAGMSVEGGLGACRPGPTKQSAVLAGDHATCPRH